MLPWTGFNPRLVVKSPAHPLFSMFGITSLEVGVLVVSSFYRLVSSKPTPFQVRAIPQSTPNSLFSVVDSGYSIEFVERVIFVLCSGFLYYLMANLLCGLSLPAPIPKWVQVRLFRVSAFILFLCKPFLWHRSSWVQISPLHMSSTQELGTCLIGSAKLNC